MLVSSVTARSLHIGSIMNKSANEKTKAFLCCSFRWVIPLDGKDFGRYWRLIVNYVENYLKTRVKPQLKVQLSSMLKLFEHHRTCLVADIFVEVFDGLWNRKLLQWLWIMSLDWKKCVISKGGGEWELHLLYLHVSDFTYNYATTELNCLLLLLLFISTWLWCLMIAFRGRILKQECFTHEKVNYCAAV